MIKFDDKELEIAIVTYNRAPFIKEWLDNCYEESCKRNISISIYDSSTNDDTEELVKCYETSVLYPIAYHKVPSDTPIGYKPMLPILKSECKYVWVSGDSRRHNFDELDNSVFSCIKNDYDYIVILADHFFNEQDYSSNNLEKFISDCFISTTCIGLSIYKTSIFDYLKNNESELEKYNKLFINNYGFGWLGYFYNAFAKSGNYKARTCDVEIINIKSKIKKQAWAKRFYECWIDNLCQLLDNIDSKYSNSYDIPRIVWQRMSLDSDHYSYIARKSGDLNKTSYSDYINNGLLERVLQHKANVKFYACAPMFLVETKHYFSRLLPFTKRVLRKIRAKYKSIF